MTAQMQALTNEVARNTAATQALTDALSKAPASEDLTPIIAQLKTNNDATEAATAALVALRPPTA